MPEENKDSLDAQTDAVLAYPEVLREAKKHFVEGVEVNYMSVRRWLSDHVTGLQYKFGERLAFRLRQDLWDKTDPDKLE
jgi:hypothetical protein